MDKLNKKELKAAYKELKVIGGICAIKNTVNGKMLILPVNNLHAYKNRFGFSQATGSLIDDKLQQDWEQFGSSSFVLEVLEELERDDNQTPQAFRDDLNTLKEIWLEKLDSGNLY